MDARELAELGKSISQRFRNMPATEATRPEPQTTVGDNAAEGTAVPRVASPAPKATQAIQDIPLELLLDSPYQPRRADITKGDVEELMKSISAAGQLQPALVNPAQGEDAGKFYVLSGHRRLTAVRLLGWPTLRAIVHGADLEARTARKIALADNLGREDLNAYELAMSFKEHCEANGLDPNSGAEDLGLTRRQATRLEAVLQASDALLDTLRMTGISARVAEHLAKIDARDSKKSLRLAQRFAAGQVTAKDIEDQVEPKEGAAKTQAAVKDVELKIDRRRLRLSLNVPCGELAGAQRERVIAALGEFMGHAGIGEVSAINTEPIEVVTADEGEVSQ